jgi:hypothetical protein
MPMIAKISSEIDRDYLPGAVHGVAQRVVVVPDAAMKLLRRTSITPPAEGAMLDRHEVDTLLQDSDLNTAEKFELKNHLAHARLLPLGRPISER